MSEPLAGELVGIEAPHLRVRSKFTAQVGEGRAMPRRIANHDGETRAVAREFLDHLASEASRGEEFGTEGAFVEQQPTGIDAGLQRNGNVGSGFERNHGHGSVRWHHAIVLFTRNGI